MKTHNDLEIYQIGMELAQNVYLITSTFPKQEIYGLSSQIKRAGVSIPSNIAEGAARQSKKEFIQFLYISLGSLAELETELRLAKTFGYMNTDSIFETIEKMRRKLLNFIKAIKLQVNLQNS
jgi:four helix bundle protein